MAVIGADVGLVRVSCDAETLLPNSCPEAEFQLISECNKQQNW